MNKTFKLDFISVHPSIKYSRLKHKNFKLGIMGIGRKIKLETLMKTSNNQAKIFIDPDDL